MSSTDSNDLWQDHKAEIIDNFSRNRFWVKKDFLPRPSLELLNSHSEKLAVNDDLKKATIGKGNYKTRNEDIRSDQIAWIHKPTTPGEKISHSLFSQLYLFSKEEFFLPAKRFECHFARYKKGDFYKRHCDRHSKLPGRLLTCVIYLNDLQDHEGGQLILFIDDHKKITIVPRAGLVVLFDSAIEHEVQVSHVERWSLTGWIRDDLHSGLRL